MLCQMLGVELVARPAHPHEPGQLEQLLPVLPGQDRLQRVGAGDEVQLRVGQQLVKITQGVDGVGVTVAVDVHATHAELRVRRRRDDRHQVTILWRRHPGMLVELLPWAPGRHKDDLVELEAMRHLAGRHQVAVVDRIEGATHHADTACTRTSSGHEG